MELERDVPCAGHLQDARRTIAVDGLSGLRNAQFATEVAATNGVPFVAEKVVYFGHNGWNGGHATVGYAP